MADDLNINITGNATGLDGASKKAKASMGGVADSAKGIEAAFKTVAKAIDPTFVALDRYNKAQAANAALLKAGAVEATAWANTQVKLRQEYDASVAAIQRKTDAGKAEAAQAKIDNAARMAEEKKAAAEAKRLAAEVKAVKAKEAKEAAAAEMAANKAAREEARAAAAEAKRLSREVKAQEMADKKAEAEAARAASKAKRDAARESSAAAKLSAREAKAAARDEARAQREAADAIAEKARAEKAAAAATTDLRASIDPAFASQTRYNATMATATQLLMQNKLKQGEWIAIQRQAKAQMDINTRSMGRMNSVYVQLGYQAQDVTAQLASGTNPLVILAQQGGQTAAAMSMMGGTVGKVAAFFAGPWGAAIIGATLLLGYFMKSEDEAKDKTLDLMDAESRRAAALPKLVEAIKEFTKAQQEANISEGESLRLKGLMIAQTEQELAARIKAQEAVIAEKRAGMEAMKSSVSFSAAAYRISQYLLDREIAKLKVLKQAQVDLGVGSDELAITRSLRQAEAATDSLTAARQRSEDNMANIRNNELAVAAGLRKRYTGKQLELKLEELHALALRARVNETNRLKAAEAAIAEQRKNAPKPTTETTSQFAQPVDFGRNNSNITSGKGSRASPGGVGSTNHAGIDIGTGGLKVAVKAAEDGVVRFAAIAGGYGNLIKLAHGANTETRYGHLSNIQVQQGQRVKKGDIIGMSGGGKGDPGAGTSTGRHLHYEVRVNGKPVDPTKGIFPIDALEAEEAAIRADADALRELQAAAQEAHEEAVGQIEFQQTLAGEDLSVVAKLQEDKITLIKAHYGASSKEASRASRELILIERRKEQQILADKKASLAEQLQAALAAEDARKEVTSIGFDIARDNVGSAESTGMMSPEDARMARAAILDAEYEEQARHENAILTLKLYYLRLNLAAENLPLAEKRKINQEIEELEASHLASMRGLNAKYNADVNRQRNESYEAQVAKWRDMASVISGSMRQAFQGIWTHQTTFFQTMVNMADAIVYKFADMGQKILEDWLVKQAIKMGLIPAQQAAETTAVAVGEATRTGVVATGEATRQGITTAGTAVHGAQELAKTGASVTAQVVQTGAKVAGEGTRGAVGAAGAIAEIGTRAATSAAGAFSSTVVIPFIGPVAAPVAAAAALAAVLGFGALVSARGGQERVPTDGQITELHKDEMVLPAWMANPFRESLRNPMANSSAMIGGAQDAGASMRGAVTSSRSDSSTFNYQPQHSNMQMDMETLLRRDAKTLRRWFSNEMRNRSFGRGD